MTPRRLGFALAMVLLVALVVGWALLQVDDPHSALDATPGGVKSPAGDNPPRSAPSPRLAPRALPDEPAGPAVRSAAAPIPTLPSPASSIPAAPRALDGAAVSTDAGVTFQLNKSGIRDAIRSRMADMAGCYDAWLQQDPTIEGNMVVGFRIVADDAGTSLVDQVQVIDGGLGQRLMEGCVLNAFQDLRFEHSDQPIEVHYPLIFSSSVDAG